MKGILFNEVLFPLVVDGTKTQTRRIIKPQPEEGKTALFPMTDEAYQILPDYLGLQLVSSANGAIVKEIKPRYKKGEKAYLKETYRFAPDADFPIYKFDYPTGRLHYPGSDNENVSVKWKNKLFMPEVVARYYIKITNIRAERLQEISEEDAIKEGVKVLVGYGGIMDQYMVDVDMGIFSSAVNAYASLIDSINGKGTWESNPYCWVYDFKLITKEDKV